MELMTRHGFKQSEAGLIPIDWSTEQIDTLVENGGLIRGPFGGALKKEFFVRNGYKVYEQKNAIYSSVELGEYYIDEAKFKELKRFEIHEEDFILSCSGTIGRIYQIPSRFEKGIINQALLIIRLNQKKAYPKYFYYQFVSDYIQNKVIDDTQGGAMKNLIGMSEFRKALIPFPPTLTEQKAIATALSDVDALISSLERLITKKKAIKQGAMQELLTPPHKRGKRLPGFSGDSKAFGWEEKTLGSVITDFQNGYAFSASGYQNEGVPIVTMAQIGLSGQFQFDENKVNYWSSNELKNLKSFTLFKGDLIISMTDVTPEKNLIGRMAIVNEPGPLFLNQRVGHLRINRELVNPIIIKHLSNMRSWRTYSKAIASLGVQANIGTTDIKNGTFWLPKIEEQNRIAQILSDMDLEIEALEAKKEKYIGIKQGMMQELLTGKIRLV